MASCEATDVMSAPTRGPLSDILCENNIFLDPSQWSPGQLRSFRIQLVDAEQSNKLVPGDPTLAVEIDTDALAEHFKQRDEHDPGCYSINQAISTAIKALEHPNIAQNHRRHFFRLGNRRCVISPSSYFMIDEISAVAVDNPANVYVGRQHRKTPNETFSYFSGAEEGAVHPVNVVQLIILAQGQAMAMKQGRISNTYPLTVGTLWVSDDGRTITAYFATVPKEYLDGLKRPDEPLPVPLAVYYHTFQITEDNYASDSSDNGFEGAIRFAVAILSEVRAIEESETTIDLDTAQVWQTNRFSGLTTYTYESVEDGESIENTRLPTPGAGATEV
ncbi:hypothetical protein Q9L58_005878 [Maublancomyces gigas]|uniref:Uncharacterized protein n=1 Tax=Discina gigas TaxID=1032678 RepID=A0ABR3GH53_9PEZI